MITLNNFLCKVSVHNYYAKLHIVFIVILSCSPKKSLTGRLIEGMAKGVVTGDSFDPKINCLLDE